MKDIAIAQQTDGFVPNPTLLRIEAARAAATAPDVADDLGETLRAVAELLEAGAQLRTVVAEVWRAAFVAGYLDGSLYGLVA